MPIKKSVLKKKWYYRFSMVVLWGIPGLSFLVPFFRGDPCKTSSYAKTLENCYPFNAQFVDGFLNFLLWLVILFVVWKIILYIAFGKVSDSNSSEKSKPTNSSTNDTVSEWALAGYILAGFAGVFVLALISLYLVKNVL